MMFKGLNRFLVIHGLKKVAIDAILPMILLPIMFAAAALSLTFTILVCVAVPLFISYAQHLRKQYFPKTKFFMMWAFWSIVYLFLLFQFTVPLFELLPEENFIFISAIFGSIFCFYETKCWAPLNYVASNDVCSRANDDNQTRLLVDDNDESYVDTDESLSDGSYTYKLSQTTNVCPKCCKYIPPGAAHCKICQQCISKQSHHSVWLDCCIGESNRRVYILGCLLGTIALLDGANLSMTAICHPFLIFQIFKVKILLPDDCSDAYDEYETAVCFVGSIYSLVVGVCCILALLQQILISFRTISSPEWQRKDKSQSGFFRNLKMCLSCSR